MGIAHRNCFEVSRVERSDFTIVICAKSRCTFPVNLNILQGIDGDYEYVFEFLFQQENTMIQAPISLRHRAHPIHPVHSKMMK